jgi:hypothetical protein
MRNEECGNCIGGSPKTSTAGDAMQNARDVLSLLTKSRFASGSTATTYWTLWTDTISGILLFSEIQTAGTSKRVSVTSASLNLQNVASYSAVHFLKNYYQSNCQRGIMMSLIKRVMIGGSSSRRLGSRPQRIVE